MHKNQKSQSWTKKKLFQYFRLKFGKAVRSYLNLTPLIYPNTKNRAKQQRKQQQQKKEPKLPYLGIIWIEF